MSSSLYYLSNSLEVLYYNLRDTLFQKEAHPFRSRWVIVPSAKMASWLTWRMAKDCDVGIFFGVECLSVLEVLEKLARLPGFENLKRSLFTDLGLVLAIEAKLRSYLEGQRQPELEPLFAYFGSEKRETKRGEELLSEKGMARLSSLAKTLAKLFKSYTLFGEQMCGSWLKEIEASTAMSDENCWQKKLFCDLFLLPTNSPSPSNSNSSPFTCLFSALKEVSPSPFIKESLASIELHFFALDFVPPILHRFFNSLNDSLQIFHYVLSPCALFWSDLYSQRQQDKLFLSLSKKEVPLSKLQALQELISDTHLLLANHGRVGRLLAKLIEEEDYSTVQDYRLSTSIASFPPYEELLVPEVAVAPQKEPLSLLSALKTDLLLLRTNSAQLIDLPLDHSLQIHQAPTLLREVEILCDRLLELASVESLSPIAQESILVLAPDMRLYEPYIRRVFERRQPLFDIQILDVPTTAPSSLIVAFKRLLKLAQSRFGVKEVLALLDCPAFAFKLNFSEAEILELASLLQRLGIRWGFDSQHRQEVVSSDLGIDPHLNHASPAKSDLGTWEWGLSRALFGLVYKSREGSAFQRFNSLKEFLTAEFTQEELTGLEASMKDSWKDNWKEDLTGNEENSRQAPPTAAAAPIDLDPSKWELVAKLTSLIRSLKRDLKPLHEKKWLKLEDWIAYFETLLEAYFASDLTEEDEDDYQLLAKEIRAFKKVPFSLDTPFSYISIKKHLFNALDKCLAKKEAASFQLERKGIVFASYNVGSALPCDVICLLGMDEDSFPRREEFLSLDLRQLQIKASQQASKQAFSFAEPSQLERERYLFLETLLAAKKHLLIFYQSYSFSEGKEKLPSLVVTELLTCLDRSFTLDGQMPSAQIVHHHPFHPYDSRAFQQQSPLLQCHQPLFFRAYQQLQRGASPKKNFLRLNEKKASQLPQVIDIAHLKSLIADPFKFFLEKQLGLYLKEYENPFIDRFNLNSLEEYFLRRQVLKSNLQGYSQDPFKFWEAKGKLPPGLFKDVAKKGVLQKVDDYIDSLKHFNVSKQDLFELELLLGIDRPLPLKGGKVLLPPLDLTLPCGQKIQIIGKIQDLSPSGLICYGSKSSDLIKGWPEFLILNALCQQYKDSGGLYQNQLLWLAKKEAKQPFFASPWPELNQLITHYLRSLQEPFLLLPEWIEPFLKNQPLNDICKKYLENSFVYQSPYLHYCTKGTDLSVDIESDASIELLQRAKEVFSPLIAAWLAPKEKKKKV